jgi:Thiamine pyrophosphate enzyme, N-terminal TPP binding domain
MTAEGFRSARFTRPRRGHKWYKSLRGSNQARTERALSTVREVTYDVLRNLGMNVIFGNPGSTELPFLRDMPSDFRHVLGLHERVAAGMGLGYAMATGKAAFVNLHSIAKRGQRARHPGRRVVQPRSARRDNRPTGSRRRRIRSFRYRRFFGIGCRRDAWMSAF